jgi:hypothetical protein
MKRFVVTAVLMAITTLAVSGCTTSQNPTSATQSTPADGSHSTAPASGSAIGAFGGGPGTGGGY